MGVSAVARPADGLNWLRGWIRTFDFQVMRPLLYDIAPMALYYT